MSEQTEIKDGSIWRDEHGMEVQVRWSFGNVAAYPKGSRTCLYFLSVPEFRESHTWVSDPAQPPEEPKP